MDTAVEAAERPRRIPTYHFQCAKIQLIFELYSENIRKRRNSRKLSPRITRITSIIHPQIAQIAQIAQIKQ